ILGLCAICPSSLYPYWGPKIIAGGTCGHKYRTSEDLGLPKSGNGCGSEGGFPIPDTFFGLVDFTSCCDGHDICYSTCGNSKTACDLSLGSCMAAACSSIWYAPPLLLACLAQAATYPTILTPVGWPAYEAAQDSNCKWEPCCKK
ncbi:MAG: hypothetical protein HYV36_07430, partial [Lentisphaerae bacterium]|nr:hypothetical protein [Lentisphaerota bacterium]